MKAFAQQKQVGISSYIALTLLLEERVSSINQPQCSF